jgi:choline dehydrogenase-like flavoprotein
MPTPMRCSSVEGCFQRGRGAGVGQEPCAASPGHDVAGRDARCRRCEEHRPFIVPDRIPGYAIHELGIARMESDPKTSVLNLFQQSHDVPNLFVMYSASLPSGACQNPVLTIMTLAVRSTDHLLKEMKRGTI